MASKQVFLSGKCRFCHVHAPDKFGHWSVRLYLDEASKVEWAKLKAGGVLNRMKTDAREGGAEYVTLRCPTQKKIKGEMTNLNPPVVMKDGLPYIGLVGDGSDITCMLTVYNYRNPMTQEQGSAIRLSAIKVSNLIEATLKQFPATDQQKAVDIIGVPDPIW